MATSLKLSFFTILLHWEMSVENKAFQNLSVTLLRQWASTVNLSCQPGTSGPFQVLCFHSASAAQKCTLSSSPVCSQHKDTQKKVICLVTGWKKTNIPCWLCHWNCSEPVIWVSVFYKTLIYKLWPTSNSSRLFVLIFWGITWKGEIPKGDPGHWTECYRGWCCDFPTCTWQEIDLNLLFNQGCLIEATGKFSSQKVCQDIWKSEDLDKKLQQQSLSGAEIWRGTNAYLVPCSDRLVKE